MKWIPTTPIARSAMHGSRTKKEGVRPFFFLPQSLLLLNLCYLFLILHNNPPQSLPFRCQKQDRYKSDFPQQKTSKNTIPLIKRKVPLVRLGISARIFHKTLGERIPKAKG